MSCTYGGTTSTFKYGADGLRRQATVGGVTTDYVYDGSTLIREGHASGGTLTPSTITATYLTGPRGPEYRRDDTQQESDGQGHTFGKTRWYVYDGLGSVVGEMDPNGSLTSSPKYDVYGLVRSNSGTASSKMGFVGGLGHLSEAGTGLIYMKARYYDPNNGRFASEDPSQNGNNWFVYASNSPANRVDASGKIDVSLIKQGFDLMEAGAKTMFSSLHFYGEAAVDDVEAAGTDDSAEGAAMETKLEADAAAAKTAGGSALQQGFEMWNAGFALIVQGIMSDGPPYQF